MGTPRIGGPDRPKPGPANGSSTSVVAPAFRGCAGRRGRTRRLGRRRRHRADGSRRRAAPSVAGLPGTGWRRGDGRSGRARRGREFRSTAFTQVRPDVLSDPIGSFANIFRALRPGGRLAASVWQHLDQTVDDATTATATQILGMDRAPLPETGSPGPFSWLIRSTSNGLYRRRVHRHRPESIVPVPGRRRRGHSSGF